MNLRSLVDWGLIPSRIHIRGDRKEYFTALTDVWQMFETIIPRRSCREVEPIVETIRKCRGNWRQRRCRRRSAKSPEARAYLDRLDAMNDFC